MVFCGRIYLVIKTKNKIMPTKLDTFADRQKEIARMIVEKGTFTPNSEKINVMMNDSELAIIPANDKRESY